MLKTRRGTGYKRTRKDVRYDGVRIGRTIAPVPTRVATASHYAGAVLAPLAHRSGDARIPDLSTYRTATSTLQLEATIANVTTAGSYYCGGLLILHSNGVRYFSAASGYTDNSFTWASTSVANSNTWNGVAALGNTLLPGAYNLGTICSGYRIVGAGLQVEFLGNDSNNQGQITGAALSSNDCEDLNQHYVNDISSLENLRGNYTGAAKNGVYVRYSPSDDMDLQFGTARTSQATISTARYDAVNLGFKNYGALQWHATGLASTAQFRVTIRVHVEAIPAVEYSDLDLSISPVSSYALESALTASALVPQASAACPPEVFSRMTTSLHLIERDTQNAQAQKLAAAIAGQGAHGGTMYKWDP